MCYQYFRVQKKHIWYLSFMKKHTQKFSSAIEKNTFSCDIFDFPFGRKKSSNRKKTSQEKNDFFFIKTHPNFFAPSAQFFSFVPDKPFQKNKKKRSAPETEGATKKNTFKGK